MKIVSWNVNGLRAVNKRNFSEWLKETNADIVCLQEIKAQCKQLPAALTSLPGYYAYFNCGNRKGYAGVAVYSKQKPDRTQITLGLKRFDEEGRMLILEYGNLVVINLYLPHGGRGKENLGYKLEVYDKLFHYLQEVKTKKAVLIGDFNVAHTELDLARPKQNKKNIMFTPEEREQLNRLVKLGFCDSLRKFHPEGELYTWWSYYADARNRNLGWRIDYAFVSKLSETGLKSAFILDKVMGSDHCPIGIELF